MSNNDDKEMVMMAFRVLDKVGDYGLVEKIFAISILVMNGI